MHLYHFTLNTYHFEISFVYSGYALSRRNDENDIWGHEWGSYYKQKEHKELREFEDKHDYYPDSWDCNDPLDEEYYKISKKYNPVIQKTQSGEPYLYSVSATTKYLPNIYQISTKYSMKSKFDRNYRIC